jgi:hypothetical protein
MLDGAESRRLFNLDVRNRRFYSPATGFTVRPATKRRHEGTTMRTRRLSLLAFLALPAVGAAVACGSSNQDGVDAGTRADDAGIGPDVSVEEASASDGGSQGDGKAAAMDTGIPGDNCPAVDAGNFVEAKHGPLPTMTNYGGAILAAPQVITFTFSTTPSATALQSFGQTITQSAWFATVTKDYCTADGGTCIQPGPAGLAVDITAAAASTYVDTLGQGTATGGTDLEQFMNQQISAAVAANTIPAPGANSLYAFYFPPTSTIWMGAVNQGAQSCQGFGGYHSSMTYTDGKTPIVYAILPDCPSGDPTYDLEGVTIAASHEIAEATTDPNPGGVPTWYLDQPLSLDAGITVPQFRNDPWATSSQFGEIGDNCESIPLSYWPLDDAGTIVQRIWSTSAAAQGHNPCVPVPAGESYYNASTDKALYVANVGDSFMVDVSAFSDMPRVSWRLDAIDQTPTQMTGMGGAPTAYLQLEFVNGVTRSDGVSTLPCVNNGTTGQLKVTLLADPDTDTSLQQGEEWPEADGVIYSADIANATSTPTPDGGSFMQFPYQFWAFAVVTPATAAKLGVTSAGVADARKLAALRAAHHAHAPRRLAPRL